MNILITYIAMVITAMFLNGLPSTNKDAHRNIWLTLIYMIAAIISTNVDRWLG